LEALESNTNHSEDSSITKEYMLPQENAAKENYGFQFDTFREVENRIDNLDRELQMVFA